MPWPDGELGLDLAEERVVLLDHLAVLDLDPGLLGEQVDRRVVALVRCAQRRCTAASSRSRAVPVFFLLAQNFATLGRRIARRGLATGNAACAAAPTHRRRDRPAAALRRRTRGLVRPRRNEGSRPANPDSTGRSLIRRTLAIPVSGIRWTYSSVPPAWWCVRRGLVSIRSNAAAATAVSAVGRTVRLPDRRRQNHRSPTGKNLTRWPNRPEQVRRSAPAPDSHTSSPRPSLDRALRRSVGRRASLRRSWCARRTGSRCRGRRPR